MVNNTVKKTGKAAGYADKTIIAGMQAVQTERDLKTPGKVNRPGLVAGEFIISIKAYPGGNPNKARRDNEEITH